jgi:LacI family transcriptional regulator
MSRNVTLKDVATRAGVHPGTASRALNPETRSMVNEATVRKVQQAAKALSYSPNPMARGLKTNRTMMVGVIVPDLTNALFPPIVRGAEEVLTPSGYLTVVAETDNDAVRERAMFDALQARQVDGLIVASAHRQDPTVQEAAERGVPVVLVNRRDDGAPLPVVLGDDVSGIEQAVRHLVDLGHRRIGHLAGPADLSTGHLRTRAFRQCMDELGADLDPTLSVVCRTYSEEEGANAARQLLDGARVRPTAIVAGNDQIAVGLYDVLRERGLTVPDDVSVVGYNDMPYVDRLSPPLTTVRVPHAEMGAEAARMLLRRLLGQSSEVRTVSLPVELIVRGSTAAPR